MSELDDLLTRLAQGLTQGADAGVPLPVRLCASAARLLDCDGAAITMAYSRPERVTLATTDDVALILEEAQDVVGQGPGPDAYATAEYQRLELSEDGTTDSRWPLLRFDSVPNLAPVVVHAVPLRSRDSAIGVLTLYQRGHGRRIDLPAAQVVARAAVAALLTDVPSELDAEHGVWSERAEVHQATGMIVAQLHIPEDDALALIRAHAYSHDQSVTRSARAILTHQLRFSASPDHEIEST